MTTGTTAAFGQSDKSTRPGLLDRRFILAGVAASEVKRRRAGFLRELVRRVEIRTVAKVDPMSLVQMES